MEGIIGMVRTLQEEEDRGGPIYHRLLLTYTCWLESPNKELQFLPVSRRGLQFHSRMLKTSATPLMAGTTGRYWCEVLILFTEVAISFSRAPQCRCGIC